MANVRDSDTSLWLHNKLGISNDSWTTGSICTQLNKEVLKNIKDCFPDLQTQVKLKLLLSFFHIPRRNVEEWKNELEEIIEVAAVDSDLWVAMLAEVLKTFPSTGILNTEISEFDETRPIFSDMINELKKSVNKHSDLGLLPLECLYLNKNALVSVVGQQATPVKHFTLKRKPKSVALRSELLGKASEAQASVRKAAAPTVPVRSRGMPRKMTDTTPLKGLPSRWAVRSGAAAGARVAPAPAPARPQRPGIKLLDIAEQPATHQQMKKRRKLELEESAAAAKSKGGVGGPPSPPPDYAKGLNSFQMPKPDPDLAPAEGSPAVSSETAAVTKSEPVAEAAKPEPAEPAVEPAAHAVHRPILVQQGAPKSIVIGGQAGKLVLAGTGAGGATAGGKQVVVQNVLKNAVLVQHAPGGNTLLLHNIKQVGGNVVGSQARPTVHAAVLQPAGQTTLAQARPQLVVGQAVNSGPVVGQVVQQVTTQLPVHQYQVQAQPVQQPAAAQPTQPQPASTLLPRRGLSLTREQMLEAQDMFRNANRVTRPEKALILGFMAGSRDNPCPNLGNIVTIKLSENIENVLQSDDTYLTMLSEMHFQMNYNNGQWTRLKKYRPIDGVLPQKIPPGSTVITQNTPQPIVSIANQSVS